MESKLLTIFFLATFQWNVACGLIDISVPNFKQASENATLRCMYKLGSSATLYSIKWYKNDYEFYRYVPREFPQKQSFQLSGVLVNLEDSDEYQVTLRNLSLASSGTYTCEISTEAPVFHTTTAKAIMTIIALPMESPKIIGLQGVYRDGDIIDINCTSSPSLPVTQLAWYVNGAKANSSWVTTYNSVQYLDTKLETITVAMQIKARQHLFPGRVLSVRCIGSLAQRSWQEQRWTNLYQLSNGQADNLNVPKCGGLLSMVSLLISLFLFHNMYFGE